MYIARFEKTPNEEKRYNVDYINWLGPAETISSVVFTVVTNSIVIPFSVDAYQISVDGKSISFFVVGGELNTQYDLDISITTSDGQIKESLVLFIVQGP